MNRMVRCSRCDYKLSFPLAHLFSTQSVISEVSLARTVREHRDTFHDSVSPICIAHVADFVDELQRLRASIAHPI